MGIGFVLFSWLVIFAIFAGSYIFLRLLVGKFYEAKILKNGLPGLIAFFAVAGITLFLVSFGGMTLDYFIPGRVFTRYFGVSPTQEVKSLEGYDIQGYSSELRFQTDKNTIRKIEKNGFTESQIESRKAISSDVPPDYKEILQKPLSHLYSKHDANNSYYLAYDEESGKAYFYLVCLD